MHAIIIYLYYVYINNYISEVRNAMRIFKHFYRDLIQNYKVCRARRR